MRRDSPARQILFALWTLACFSSVCSGATCAEAGLVVRNGHIITMDGARRTVSALAIRDGKILAVGTDLVIAECIGPRTQVIDLKGLTVLPGLIDVHTHALEWAKGVVRKEIDARYPQVSSVADIVRGVRERAVAAAPGEW